VLGWGEYIVLTGAKAARGGEGGGVDVERRCGREPGGPVDMARLVRSRQKAGGQEGKKD